VFVVIFSFSSLSAETISVSLFTGKAIDPSSPLSIS
jgi:hypothetical protein